MPPQIRRRARPADTTAEVWALQMQRFAAMTPAERAELANRLSIDCVRLARSRPM